MTSFIWFLALLLSSTPSIDASCEASDDVCQPGGGNCLEAVRLAFGGDVNVASEALKYGKYCGVFNKCQEVKVIDPRVEISDLDPADVCGTEEEESYQTGENKKSRKGKQKMATKGGEKRGKKGEAESISEDSDPEPCPAVPCDVIDTACAAHDACLDNEILINTPPPGAKVPIPQRCRCDVDFLYEAAVLSQTIPSTGLCDAAFYMEPISEVYPTGITVLRHEANLVAGPSCCTVFADLDGNGTPDCAEDINTDQEKFPLALLFCQTFIGGLSNIGVNICP